MTKASNGSAKIGPPMRLEWYGQTYTLSALANHTGVHKRTLWGRLRRGLSVRDAVRQPLRSSVATESVPSYTRGRAVRSWLIDLCLQHEALTGRPVDDDVIAEAVAGIAADDELLRAVASGELDVAQVIAAARRMRAQEAA